MDTHLFQICIGNEKLNVYSPSLSKPAAEYAIHSIVRAISFIQIGYFDSVDYFCLVKNSHKLGGIHVYWQWDF
jgi:hypothetical protein